MLERDAQQTEVQREAEQYAASIDTREPKRDAHLRSADFFDVEKFPALRFHSTSVKRTTDDTLAVSGDLTLHGITHPVTLIVDELGGGKDPWGNDRLAWSGRIAINRKDFGLNWNQLLEAGGVLVSEKIDIELEIQAL